MANSTHLFLGEHRHSVDSKGRVAVPKPFRKRLSSASEGKLILLLGRDRTIEVHPLSEWNDFVGRSLRKLPRYDPRAVRVRRNRYRAHEVEMDAQGRILLPKVLRDQAGIAAEVVFAGAGEFFEIWQPVSYEAYHGDVDARIMEDLAALEKAGWGNMADDDEPAGGNVPPAGDGR